MSPRMLCPSSHQSIAWAAHRDRQGQGRRSGRGQQAESWAPSVRGAQVSEAAEARCGGPGKLSLLGLPALSLVIATS